LRDPVREYLWRKQKVPRLICRRDGTVPKGRHEAGTFIELDEKPT
jgi:hypothetical protein